MYKGLCVINMKGGVGKTTVSVNLGWEAAERGLKCLVVDLDPQFNASVYLMGEDAYEEDIMENRGLTIFDIFEQHTSMRDPQRPHPTANNVIRQVSPHRHGEQLGATQSLLELDEFWENSSMRGQLDVIPSQLELAESLKNPSEKSHLLSTFLVQHAPNYDLVIVDPPPTDSMATAAAYLATNYVLIPVRPEFLSSVGFRLLGRSIDSFKRQYQGHSLDVVGMFLSNVNPRLPEYEKTKVATREFARSQNWRFLTNEIRFSQSYTRGSREGRSIADTQYARSNVINEFSDLAGEVFSLMGISARSRQQA